jgi:glucose/arabinose dehydrogenase
MMKNSHIKIYAVSFFILAAVVFYSFRQTKNTTPAIHLKLNQVAKGFTSPIGMASPKDGTNRLFVIEQRGKIKIIKKGVVNATSFLDVSDKIDPLNIAYSEKGLLGLAFHPQFKTNGKFYIYYSAPFENKNYDHKSIVAAYKVSSTNPDIADTKEEILMEIAEPESNHNGGCLQFGKDGYLYMGVGDGGGGGDQHGTAGNGQDLSTLLGKILRIDVDAKHPYAIPADNPFAVRQNAKPEIYAYGLRNPWRFSFDRATGRLYCGDVGQNKWEETDIIEKGKNYGWRIMEGYHCYSPASGCNMEGLTLPIDEYEHEIGISICGGYVYRGYKFPSLQGYYIFGDWNGKLFYLKQDKKGDWNRGEVYINDTNSNDIGAKLNSMGEDERGELYLITQHLFGPKSPTGAVYQLGF